MIKQLHKRHYQLHLLLTSLTSFLSYIYELTEVYILFQMFCLTSYMKSILEGPWLLGAQGSRLPLPNG